jgi:hypothetical protein
MTDRDECETCGGDHTVYCSACAGSGEGQADGSRCQCCKGSDVRPCPDCTTEPDGPDEMDYEDQCDARDEQYTEFRRGAGYR